MGKKRKNYSNEFKFKVALAALKCNKTIAQLSTEYELAPSVIQRWKMLVQKMGHTLFNENIANMNIAAAHEAEKAKLYQQIGQLTVEHEFLKKALSS